VIENLTNGFWFGRKATADPAGAFLAAFLLFGLVGMVGKSVYFISKKPQSAQFEEELQRLFASAIYLVDTRKTPSVNMPSAHRHDEANHVLTQQESTLLCLSTPIRKGLVVSAIVAPLESC
jgi:hypothetical protein